jgi:sirohydrochlorin cobaltochelatase
MATKILLAVDQDLEGALAAARRCASQLSYEVRAPVVVVDVTSDQLDAIEAAAGVEGKVIAQPGRKVAPPTDKAAPMAPAPFRWRDDGRPDWGNMWQDFCELALFGGPPHRGEEQALRAGPAPAPAAEPTSAVEEIQRGIVETTGLVSAPTDDGWLAVTCDSPKMAAWLCATIILENVDARCEGTLLFVPASPDYALADQVKSVVTVVAKTHHYWQAHVVKSRPS